MVNMKDNATNTHALDTRIGMQSNQCIDLNDWIFDHLNIQENGRVLELCCGTGAQTSYFSKRIKTGSLVCVDINAETLLINKQNVCDSRILYLLSDLDELEQKLKTRFDLIFCAYGFYYSRRPKELFQSLKKHLLPGGRFVLVGPILGNNAELYNIVRNAGASISQEVLYSSEEFLIDFFKLFLGNFELIRFERVINTIRFESAHSLLAYWRNTTFYIQNKDQSFLEECSSLYGNNPITVNKSIGYLEGRLSRNK